MKTVLLTGAFGNLGCYVLRELLSQNYHVIAFDQDNVRNQKQAKAFEGKPNVTVFFADIRNSTVLKEPLKTVTAVIHLASILPPLTDDEPVLTQAINVDASKALIQLCEAQENAPQFLYASSFTVLGIQNSTQSPLSPLSPIAPSDNYTQQKVAVEQYLEQSSLSYMIGRIAVSIDEEMRLADKRLVKAMFNVRTDNPLEYIHPLDVAKAFVNAIDNKRADRQTFLLGGGKHCQLRQIDFVQALMGAAGLELTESDFGQATYYTNWLDTKEAQEVLQFQTVHFHDFVKDVRVKMRPIRLFVKPLNVVIKPLFKLWLKY